MKNVFIIGSDSFIATNFIKSYHGLFDISGISLKKTNLEKEIVVKSYKDINETLLTDKDVVINFAAIVHQPNIKNEGIYIEINYKLPVYIANIAKNARVKQFVQFSTIAVYGEQEKISLNTLYNPNTPYGRSKLSADLELLKLQDTDFKVCLLRPSMVYGGGKAPGNMIDLIKLCNKPIPLPFKGINNSRQFAHIYIVTNAIKNCIEKQSQGIFLIADNKGISTFDLVSLIKKSLNKKNTQIKLPVFFLNLIKKIKPSLYQKLFGSLVIDVEDTYKRLELERKDRIEQGICEMISMFR